MGAPRRIHGMNSQFPTKNDSFELATSESLPNSVFYMSVFYIVRTVKFGYGSRVLGDAMYNSSYHSSP